MLKFHNKRDISTFKSTYKNKQRAGHDVYGKGHNVKVKGQSDPTDAMSG